MTRQQPQQPQPHVLDRMGLKAPFHVGPMGIYVFDADNRMVAEFTDLEMHPRGWGRIRKQENAEDLFGHWERWLLSAFLLEPHSKHETPAAALACILNQIAAKRASMKRILRPLTVHQLRDRWK
jgi:hypothetical protein